MPQSSTQELKKQNKSKNKTHAGRQGKDYNLYMFSNSFIIFHQ
jgi:hypothetical protein